MKNKMGVGDNIVAHVEKSKGLVDEVGLKSLWEWEQWRNGQIIDAWKHGNLCTDQGLNHVLDVAFSGATATATWYIALFNNNHTPAAGNTYATPGYTESSNYDEATRPQWQEAGPSAKSITNSATKASFTMSTAETIYGASLVSSSVKGNTAATGAKVFNIAAFSAGSKAVENDDVLKVTVTLTIADA